MISSADQASFEFLGWAERLLFAQSDYARTSLPFFLVFQSLWLPIAMPTSAFFKRVAPDEEQLVRFSERPLEMKRVF